jgi:NAD(P)H-dependent FMN reductase
MLKLQILVGSTRDGRHADTVLGWLLPLAQARADFAVEVLDLRDWPLPIFQETEATVGNFADPTFSDPLVKRWNQKIKEADAYVFVTPEYNHGVPAVLKNAIDSVFCTFGFRHKPVAFVGYSKGTAAGVRAVEQLNQVMLETEALPVRTQTLIAAVESAFDAAGQPVSPGLTPTATVMLSDLSWLGRAMKAARAAGEPPPAILQIRAAAAQQAQRAAARPL